jgi:SAM-dependent methyltransferase
MSQKASAAPPEVLALDDSDLSAEWVPYRDGDTAQVVRAFLLSHVLGTLTELGLGQRLVDGANASELLSGLNAELGPHLLRFLERERVLTATEAGRYELTSRGRLLLDPVALGVNAFYREGYGPVFNALLPLLKGTAQYGKEVVRDGRAVGKYSSTMMGRIAVRVLESTMARNQATRVLDLGCGAGGVLIDLCRKNPTLHGVGLDISAEALALAESDARKAGVSDRVTFVLGDAFRPDTWPRICSSVQMLFTQGTLHEHFRDGDAAVIKLLDAYGQLMHQQASYPVRRRNEEVVRSVLIGEPELSADARDTDFWWVHALTKQGFPVTRGHWYNLVAQTGLRCVRQYAADYSQPRMLYLELALK